MTTDQAITVTPTLETALSHHQAGRLADAESVYRQMLAVEPRDFNALHLLGVIANQRGEYRLAVELIEQAIQQDAAAYPAYNNLGLAYGGLEDLDAARACFERALALQPDFAEAHHNLGSVLMNMGKLDDAAAAHRKALALNPEFAEAHLGLGKVFEAQGRTADALASYQEAALVKPDFADAQYCLGHMLQVQGLIEDALECFRAALSSRPDFVEARWSLAISQLAVVHGEQDVPEEFRAAFSEALAGLDRWFDADRVNDGFKAVGTQQPFYLAYHMHNNRELLSQYGDLCARLMRHWQERQGLAVRSPTRHEKVRVGIVSAQVFDQSVWSAIVKGWCRHLDRHHFSLSIFSLGRREDQETAFAKSQAAHFVQGPKGLREWADAILAQELDVIIYPEIGMDQITTKLASLRLCPVQVAAWGHPETTGLPTIDYYLSAEDLEPPGAQANYRERLITLPHLGCCYQALDVPPANIDPIALGIAADAPILLCPGTPFKYAPEHDWVFVEIARVLGRCQFIFFNHVLENLSEKLQHRLDFVFSQHDMYFDEFAVFIPWLTRPGFYGLLNHADVYLDTIGFSGFNTAMQAIECRLPIVTRDGEFMRGRLASGILKRMGMPELVVASDEDYVARAVKLARDASYRESVRERIGAARHVLFDDVAPVRGLEEFLFAVTRAVPQTASLEKLDSNTTKKGSTATDHGG